MKGVVFTELVEMVEEKFSPQIADRIIESSSLPSRGIYTAVGTYEHAEMLQLVARLSDETGIEIPDLLKAFGHHLFGRFAAIYATLFEDPVSVFSFLPRVDNHIHVDVRKLYEDAELPRIECEETENGQLHVVYRSQRHFADLAEGLIHGCIDHFGEALHLEREDLSPDEGSHVRFELSRTGAS